MTTDNELLTNAPTNVIAALARVEAEVGGIEKKRGGEGGVKYPFRGIDAISQSAQPLLGKYGVVMVPTVENHVVDDITVGGKPWTDTTVTVLWRIYGPGGVDDMIECRTVGYGRDNADKGMNKAMTGAFKNVLLRVLCIGDPQDDTDGHTHERDNGRSPVENVPEFSERAMAAYAALPGLSDEDKDNLKALSAEYGHKLTARDFDADEGWLLVVEAVLLGSPPATPSVPIDTPEVPEEPTGAASDDPEPGDTPNSVTDDSEQHATNEPEPELPLPPKETAAEKRKRLADEKKLQAGLDAALAAGGTT
jgi:hypothetical protein